MLTYFLVFLCIAPPILFVIACLLDGCLHIPMLCYFKFLRESTFYYIFIALLSITSLFVFLLIGVDNLLDRNKENGPTIRIALTGSIIITYFAIMVALLNNPAISYNPSRPEAIASAAAGQTTPPPRQTVVSVLKSIPGKIAGAAASITQTTTASTTPDGAQKSQGTGDMSKAIEIFKSFSELVKWVVSFYFGSSAISTGAVELGKAFAPKGNKQEPQAPQERQAAS